MMVRKHRPRSNEELAAVSEHLLYEIEMLFGAARTMATSIIGDGKDFRSWSIRNALVESFTVHVRILLDFLYPSRPKPDDVVADDFFDDASVWLEKKPAKSHLLNTVHRRVGKEIAHLTYARLDVTPDAKQWRFVDIANDVGVVLDTFCQLVSHSKVKDGFVESVLQVIRKR